MIYQFTNLQGKVAHALSFRSSVLDAHLKELTGRLYPHGNLQERTLCFLPMLAAQGMGLLDELGGADYAGRHAAPGSLSVKVICWLHWASKIPVRRQG